MAIGAQKLQVFYAVIQPVSVDVMKLECKRFPEPTPSSAPFAPRCLQALGDESLLQVVGVRRACLNENVS